MSGLLYGRTVQVSVGQRLQPNPLLIEGLRVTFKIEKTLEKTPNNSIIEIYNLSPKSRSVFEQKGAAIRVTAGYGSRAKDIFVGDIATVTTKRAGADVITQVEAGDGLLEYQMKEADLSFAPGAKVGSIFDQLVGVFGLVKGEVQGLNTNDTYLNGASFSGKIHTHFDTLIGKQQDLAWSVQDGKIQVLPLRGGLSTTAILLTPQTGLIGSPFKRVVLQQDLARKTDGQDAYNGVQLLSLLQPEITPGRLLLVQAQFVTGIFKTMKVCHEGDTHAVTFYSKVEGLLL